MIAGSGIFEVALLDSLLLALALATLIHGLGTMVHLADDRLKSSPQKCYYLSL